MSDCHLDLVLLVLLVLLHTRSVPGCPKPFVPVTAVAGPGSDAVGRSAAHPALVSRCGVEMREEMQHDQ